MFHNQWLSLWQFYQMVCQGFLSSTGDIVEPWLCPICKGCSLQCTSWCPYSCLSINIGTWSGSMYSCFLDVLIYHGLPLEWWTSMTWEWLGWEIVYQHLTCACRGVPLHEWKCWPHDVGLCHLVVFWRCVCKKGLFFASVVRHPIDQLLVILVWGYHPEKCAVGVSLEG